MSISGEGKRGEGEGWGYLELQKGRCLSVGRGGRRMGMLLMNCKRVGVKKWEGKIREGDGEG